MKPRDCTIDHGQPAVEARGEHDVAHGAPGVLDPAARTAAAPSSDFGQSCSP